MNRKRMSVLALLLALSLIMVACGGQAAAPAAEPAVPAPVVEEPTAVPAVEEPAAAAEPVVLRALIRPDEGGNVAKFSEQFMADTGIEVQTDFVGWGEIHDKTITTLASGGGGYDIVFVPSANVVEFTSGGWFEPLNDMITDANRAEWLDSVVDMYTIDGDLLAMPWYAGGAHMAYNKSVLEAAGVDPAGLVTWDDFMAACQKVIETEAAPFCFTPSAKYPGNFYYNLGTMVASAGDDFFDENGAPIFQDGSAAAAVMQMIEDGAANSSLTRPASPWMITRH